MGCLEPVSRCLNPYMKPRVEYTFKVTGCMVSMDDTCSEATTRVRLRDEKLVTVIDGGDRTLTAGAEASIDGCTFTEDPDDEDAAISYSWRCETSQWCVAVEERGLRGAPKSWSSTSRHSS